MSPRHPWIRPASIAVLALAVAVAGCGPDIEAVDALEADVADLRVELAERRDAEATLQQRVVDLEAALADATSDDGLGERVSELETELGRLVDALTVLEADLDAGAAERQQLLEDIEVADRDLRSGLTDLRGELDAVRGELDAVRGEVGLLNDQVEVLRERVDRVGG